MAKLKDIKGSAIQYLAEDPVELGLEGGSWSSGGSLNTARSGIAGAGTQSAALAFGGNIANPPNTPQPYINQALTESYNGTSWTEVSDLNKARYTNQGGCGIQTAALMIGGYTFPPSASPSPTIGIQTDVESWNGSSWTEIAEYSTSRYSYGTSVSSPYTDTLIAGGYPGSPPSALTNAVEIWDGSSWTTGTAMASPKGGHQGLGASSTAVLMASSTTESWNGSSWTEVAEKNNTRGSAGSAGPYTDGLVFGGSPNNSSAFTEHWNGSAWTELADLSTARGELTGAGSTSASSAALAAGGNNSSNVRQSVSEEWNTQPPTATGLQEGQLWFNYSASALKGYGTAAGIPAATWSSGGSLNVARRAAGGIGIQTANLFVGGEIPASPNRVDSNESYDGSSWTEVNNINTARGSESSFGSQTAGLIAGGELVPGAVGDVVESWDGTNWTEVSELNTARRGLGNSGAGTQTAGLTIGGALPAVTAVTESWDGSSWTEVSDLNTARQTLAAHGTQTDALAAAGYTSTQVNNVETWDGSAWTETTEVNTTRNKLGGAGTSTDFLVYGGNNPPVTGNTEYWNGSSWTELNNLGTSRSIGGDSGSGSGVLALASGGSTDAAPPGVTTATEEWTAPAAISTVTTS